MRSLAPLNSALTRRRRVANQPRYFLTSTAFALCAFLDFKLFLNTWVVELGFIDGALFSLLESMGSALDLYGMLARVKSRLDPKPLRRNAGYA